MTDEYDCHCSSLQRTIRIEDILMNCELDFISSHTILELFSIVFMPTINCIINHREIVQSDELSKRFS